MFVFSFCSLSSSFFFTACIQREGGRGHKCEYMHVCYLISCCIVSQTQLIFLYWLLSSSLLYFIPFFLPSFHLRFFSSFCVSVSFFRDSFISSVSYHVCLFVDLYRRVQTHRTGEYLLKPQTPGCITRCSRRSQRTRRVCRGALLNKSSLKRCIFRRLV